MLVSLRFVVLRKGNMCSSLLLLGLLAKLLARLPSLWGVMWLAVLVAKRRFDICIYIYIVCGCEISDRLELERRTGERNIPYKGVENCETDGDM